jgi:TonB family protein
VNRGLVLSTVLHAVGFALILFGPPPRARSWDLTKEIPVELVRSLPEAPAPRETKDEPPPPRPEPPVTRALDEPEPEPEPETPEVEEAEPPEPVPAPPPQRVRPPREFKRIAHRKEDDGPSFAERLRKAVATPEPDESEPRPEPPPEPPAPARSTTEVVAEDFPFAWYLNTVRTKITDSWDPPADRMISGGENRVLVRFRVLRDGRVVDIEVQDAGHTPGLDTSARRAVESAQPFPPLPPTWPGDELQVTVRFTLTEDGAR